MSELLGHLLKPGDLVFVCLRGPGELDTYRTERVLRVDPDGTIWLDNGDGNRPSKYDAQGLSDLVFGVYSEIMAVL